MKRNVITKQAFINAALTAVYVAFIAFFIHYVSQMLALPDKPDTIFAPIFMLTLFILSASVTGFLVLGRAILWYLDGKKSEALHLFAQTLGFLFVFACLFFLLLVVF